MNKSLTERILEHLLGAAEDSIYLFAAIVDSPYGSSRRQIERRAWELREGASRSSDFNRQRRNFYTLLSKLKKDGLIGQRKSKWTITKKGKEKYKFIIQRLPFRKKYKKEADLTFKLVIFDIPEKERGKRQWLRERLRELGFKMIQKSVWSGKVKLPEEFLEDLKTLNLLDYVDILAITKTGSLRSLG